MKEKLSEVTHADSRGKADFCTLDPFPHIKGVPEAMNKEDLILSWAESHIPIRSAIYIKNYQHLFFLKLCQKLGIPDVDTVASRFIKTLDRLKARSRDTLTFVVNALVIP